MIKFHDEDDPYVMNHNDYHLYHNVNEQMNDDDGKLYDDDDDIDCDKNDMDDSDVVVVLEKDFEENDEY
jgi:hypothetical protein